MATHHLKILPEYYQAVVDGDKTFEIRKNDRDFQVGDEVILRKWLPNEGYAGAMVIVRITYVTDYEQKDGYVVFAHKLMGFSVSS